MTRNRPFWACPSWTKLVPIRLLRVEKICTFCVSAVLAFITLNPTCTLVDGSVTVVSNRFTLVCVHPAGSVIANGPPPIQIVVAPDML